MTVETHDTTRCLLGEGALWHPERGQFLWCDILSRRVLSRQDGVLHDWSFDRFVSCVAWVDRSRVVVATQSDLTLLDLDADTRETLIPLEADDPGTRSNDGRADPYGGFWIGTMALDKTDGAGAIYRYLDGTLTCLRPGITIPNAICFAPGGDVAYFADTPTGRINRWDLDGSGWPVGEPEVFVDSSAQGLAPDGAVCDADGRVWVAKWGSSRVSVYAADGTLQQEIAFPASQLTCPAFGGPDLSTLFCTSASVHLPEEEVTANPSHGLTFRIEGAGHGRAEHAVRIGPGA